MQSFFIYNIVAFDHLYILIGYSEFTASIISPIYKDCIKFSFIFVFFKK